MFKSECEEILSKTSRPTLVAYIAQFLVIVDHRAILEIVLILAHSSFYYNVNGLVLKVSLGRLDKMFGLAFLEKGHRRALQIFCQAPNRISVQTAEIKTLDTIGNCHRPAFSLGVSQHTCIK